MKSTLDFINMKKEGEKIVMLTAYDHPSAKIAEEAGVDVLLVGDSLGMVVLGYESTVSVTVDDMIHHGKAVKRGATDTFIVVDMPFGSYHGSDDSTLAAAVRMFQQTCAHALKVEGAGKVIDTIRLLTSVGIPVVGHLGLLPQSAAVVGGYKVQGKTAAAAQQLIEDARASEAAGACMIVLECIPYQLADEVTAAVSIPVIGIGAGAGTDGQVLVFHDTVKYGNHRVPKFVEAFSDVGGVIEEGITKYVKAVKEQSFPAEHHRFTMKEEELVALYGGTKVASEVAQLTIIHTIQELQASLNRNLRQRKTVGFVPTMGFLHEGHLSLVEQARQQNDIVVMSIFVNPAQFGPGEDFEAYPRDAKRDASLAAEAGVDILFMPTPEEMYPQEGGIRILPGAQATELCGASRPGHFDGVLKVVLKLFNIVDPNRSYFGMKDAQQLAIIETFVRDFNLRTKIVRVPTVREQDGLAKSSRNVHLTEAERQEAPAIQQALQLGARLVAEGMSAEDIEQLVAAAIVENSTGRIDYVSLLAYPALAKDINQTSEVILACAVKFSQTRLIDNIIIPLKG